MPTLAVHAKFSRYQQQSRVVGGEEKRGIFLLALNEKGWCTRRMEGAMNLELTSAVFSAAS